MKSLIRGIAAVAAAGLILAGGAPVTAGPPKPAPKVVTPGAMSANPLNLTAAQQKKLEAIQKKYMPQVQALMNSKATDQEKQKKFEALGLKIDKEVNAILTPQQRKQKAQMEAKYKTQVQQGRAEMARRVQKEEAVYKTMTPAQKKKLDAINKDVRARADVIQKDKKLSQQQKNQKLSALLKELRQKRMAVLTPQQRAKLGVK